MDQQREVTRNVRVLQTRWQRWREYWEPAVMLGQLIVAVMSVVILVLIEAQIQEAQTSARLVDRSLELARAYPEITGSAETPVDELIQDLNYFLAGSTGDQDIRRRFFDHVNATYHALPDEERKALQDEIYDRLAIFRTMYQCIQNQVCHEPTLVMLVGASVEDMYFLLRPILLCDPRFERLSMETVYLAEAHVRGEDRQDSVSVPGSCKEYKASFETL